MRSHDRFDHSWHVDASADAVLEILEDVRGYGAWWPAVRVTGGSLAGERQARQPLLRAASPLLHGAFARQHGAVMRSAEQGLCTALRG